MGGASSSKVGGLIMGRKRRELMDEGYYHVISRGNNGLNIFDVPNGYQVFKFMIYESKKKYKWKLLHYCIMPNHFHLLGQVSKGADLPKIMQLILLKYSYWHKASTQYVGHLWQNRYRSPLIDKDSYLLECGRYIERNPVRAGLVSKPEQYLWSSYRHYAYKEKDPLVDNDPSFSDFGQDETECQLRYKEFVSFEGPYDRAMDNMLIASKSKKLAPRNTV